MKYQLQTFLTIYYINNTAKLNLTDPVPRFAQVHHLKVDKRQHEEAK